MPEVPIRRRTPTWGLPHGAGRGWLPSGCKVNISLGRLCDSLHAFRPHVIAYTGGSPHGSSFNVTACAGLCVSAGTSGVGFGAGFALEFSASASEALDEIFDRPSVAGSDLDCNCGNSSAHCQLPRRPPRGGIRPVGREHRAFLRENLRGSRLPVPQQSIRITQRNLDCPACGRWVHRLQCVLDDRGHRLNKVASSLF
jgi:hypothetical protein